MSVLPNLNWSTYNKVSGHGAMKLMTWLYAHPAVNAPDIACILNSTNGLDGVYAEQYTNVVGKMCSSSPREFVQALATLTEDGADKIRSCVKSYSAENDMAGTYEELASFANSPSFSTDDKALIERLMKAME